MSMSVSGKNVIANTRGRRIPDWYRAGHLPAVAISTSRRYCGSCDTVESVKKYALLPSGRGNEPGWLARREGAWSCAQGSGGGGGKREGTTSHARLCGDI